MNDHASSGVDGLFVAGELRRGERPVLIEQLDKREGLVESLRFALKQYLPRRTIDAQLEQIDRLLNCIFHRPERRDPGSIQRELQTSAALLFLARNLRPHRRFPRLGRSFHSSSLRFDLFFDLVLELQAKSNAGRERRCPDDKEAPSQQGRSRNP